jgi:hypothetical protein
MTYRDREDQCETEELVQEGISDEAENYNNDEENLDVYADVEGKAKRGKKSKKELPDASYNERIEQQIRKRGRKRRSDLYSQKKP